jgi:hypothetical protein
MATEKWVGGSGVGLTWTSISSTEINSLANGNAVLLATQIDNTSALDMFMDIGVQLGSAAFAAPNYLGVYLYPLNQDGSTYGDGRFTSSTTAAPPVNYYCGSIGLNPATSAQEGVLTGIVIPPGKFKIVLMNNGGVALASGSNTVYYRTYNRQVA